uniref:Serine/threonine-protein kinase Nek4 n=1 Tax=Astyanax mexicanus TaxID=7994 RepID=A0A3B1IU06_ASTMX
MESYGFIRVVGKGSYGEVNLVQHKSDRKQYVIKKLNLRTSSKRERRAAEQEAQLLSQLKHPNIVTYRESWEGDDCQLYIVMGFCEGGDLYHRLKQQKGELLPERQVVEWFVQIAMALQYLHEKHILHRDLKTQNIFLTKTNIIKVGDLGIARVLENQNDMASTLIGTPYYMSPELFSNKPYNYKSDVWALGCCVYEMSTLKHAFNAKDMNSLAFRIIEGKLPQMPSKYDPQLGELIKRMLCKKPEDRPDVKHILRQPFIKQQIAIFLEATKEKTAKSRKKVMNSKSNSTPNAAVLQKQENSLQCLNSEPKSRGKKSEEKILHQHNAAKDPVPPNGPLPPKPPNQDALNLTGQSLATISNINIDIQPPEPKPNPRKAKPPRPVSAHAIAGKPPSVSKQREIEKKEKEDPFNLQPHPRKPKVLGDHSREDELLSHPVIPQLPKGDVPPKPTDRLRHYKENKAPNGNLAVEEDTLKLLQQAEMENIDTEIKLENQAGPQASRDHRTGAALRDVSAKSHAAEGRTSLESTDKLLEPFVPVVLMEPHNPEPAPAPSQRSNPPLHPASSSSEPSMSRQRRQRKKAEDDPSREKAANSRPLPPLPEHAPSVNTQAKPATHSASSNSRPAPQNRLLSARERRRLRQSQENQSEQAAPAVRRASCDVSSLGSEHADQPDCPRPASVAVVTHKERKSSWRSDEEECSSSTSSTERSEGEYREGKNESSEMQDLVQMMTQTLRMDFRDVSQSNSTLLPEFKLNRKYRDTLMLHGKACDGEVDFHIKDFPSEDSSGPAKIRRAVEHLRTDVVKGLGVKLLDKVLEIMQEEDEEKREVLLRQQMGEEKYKTYAVMVRQLKFFEDVAFKH